MALPVPNLDDRRFQRINRDQPPRFSGAWEHNPDHRQQPRARRGKPAVPAWEDVLLGVRSSGQR